MAMRKSVQYLCFALLFIFCLLFFVYLMFPFNIVKESLVMKVSKATGLNLTVENLAPALVIGLEAKGVRLKTTGGEELTFAEIDVSVNPFYVFIGQLKGAVEIYDAKENPLELVVKFGLFDLLSKASKGQPPLPSQVTLIANNYQLDDLSSYALSSYINGPNANPLVAPLLQQMAVRGNLNADIALALNADDPSNSEGRLDLRLDKFVLALNSPDLNLEEQRFEKASVKANLMAGSLKIEEGSAFASQDIEVGLGGDLNLKSPILASTMNLSIPLQIKGVLKDQFGFLITSLLKGGGDGTIPLQIRGTLQRPAVSYN